MAIFSPSFGVISGLNDLKLSGINAVGFFYDFTSNPSIIYNSINSGLNWTTALTLTPSGNDINIDSIDISGNNALFSGGTTVGGITSGFLYYSMNAGATWTLNSNPSLILASIISTKVSISGDNALIAVKYVSGTPTIFYSSDAGITWTASIISSGSIPENVETIIISGNNAIFSTERYLYNSTNGGQTWTQQIDNSISGIIISAVSLSGTNVVIGLENNISTSTNVGVTWYNFSFSSNIVISCSSISGNNAVAGTFDTVTNYAGIVNSNNVNLGASVTWNSPASGQILNSSISNISLFDNNAIANIFTSTADYSIYSSNNIQLGTSATWQITNLNNISNINNISVSGNNAIIAGSVVYYSSTPICYEKNTLILVSENKKKLFKKVFELKVGDIVKTYNHGYKKIKIIKSFKYKIWNRENELNYLYRMKENGVILTAGHSLLVDELTKKQKLLHSKYNFNQKIDDKKLLLALANDKFEKIDDDQEYELYHFVLESNDPNLHYGIYINDGYLSESCSETAMLQF